MTTFEITIIVLLAAIVILLILVFTGMATTYVKMKEGFEYLGKKIEYCDTKLGYIKGAAQDISQQLANIEDDILDDLRDIRIADKLGKTSPNVPTPLPCYAPNGICTNPQMDCINCPKRGTGGTWSTSINTNKED
jgi:hypothetical protein